jgi:hypothetical protein
VSIVQLTGRNETRQIEKPYVEVVATQQQCCQKPTFEPPGYGDPAENDGKSGCNGI